MIQITIQLELFIIFPGLRDITLFSLQQLYSINLPLKCEQYVSAKDSQTKVQVLHISLVQIQIITKHGRN